MSRRRAAVPSPAQLRARAKFAAAARARAKAAKKGKKNPGVIKFTEAELAKYGGKIRGLGGSVARSTGLSASRKKRGARFKKTGVFGGSGFLGLGRSRKTIKAGNPKGKHLPGLPAKFQRMYTHILDSTGDKRIAAATTRAAVNRQNPSLFGKLFGRKRKAAPIGYRRTQAGRRRIAPVGYRKTQRGQKRPTAYMQAQSLKRSRSRLLNPSPASVFSEFRGKDVTRKTQEDAAPGTPSTLAKLGRLVSLKIEGRVKGFPSSASLAADGRKRLHIVGVKSKASRDEVDYGQIDTVIYRADKVHIEKGVLDYEHHFAEEGGRKPHLVVDREGYFHIEGGSYRISADGIIN